jgi:8-amino-7-oxononanoate synthase
LDLFAKAAKYTRPEEVRRSGLYPYFRAIEESHAGTRVRIGGRSLVMAGSNNYLGLTHDPRVMEAAQRAVARYGTGCTGSRFLNGTLSLHEELEERLARFLGKEACITSGTGFQTNIGAISSLMGREDVIFGDRDNHASIIDGCRLSFARLLKYKHNDVAELGRLLEETQVSEGGARLVVTDGVFSMLGDLAPLREILPLAHRHEARVLVDDAHALGVLGPHGRGTGEHFGVHDQVDLIVGTFSKSLACLGGFLAGPRVVVELVKHTSRSVVFSASMTPASVATVIACLDIVEKEPQRRDRLWANVRYVKRGLQELGLEIIDAGSPILSVVIGDDVPTFQFNNLLFEHGVFVNPIIPPAVPPGMSLLRTSYMATHTQEDLDVVLKAFKLVAEQLRILG